VAGVGLRLLPAAAVLAVALAVVCAAPAADPRQAGAVAVENQRPGTPGWLGRQVTDRSAEVYASQTDAVPGDAVALHVSTTPAASYRVLVYRVGWYRGIGGRQVACLPSCTGAEQGAAQPVPAPDPSTGEIVAGWPVTDTLKVGRRWVSGYYQVRVLLTSGPAAGKSATTYVIVRSPASHSPMLVQVPVNTWQAYNSWGGKSLYDLPGLQPRAHLVSFDRPYAWFGPGGQSPLGWEVPLVRFIERNRWDVSYQSDVYTDAHPTSLLRHRLVVDAGHDEYWSGRMRDAFDAARDRGVNLAFMGANDAYWQVVLQNGGRAILAYKSLYDPNPNQAQKTAMFRELTPPRYECELIGIQHQGVGLTWQPGNYTVVDASDPWMHGTGFTTGAVVKGIVSVEADTIPGNQSAAASCGHVLTVFFHRERGGDKDGNADATRYITPRGSAVFASGSHQFAWGLDDFKADPQEGHGFADRRLQRFMHNAFSAMLAP
jgi:N,N-dimethylformamidase beta subunit-like, C-terminal